MSETSTSGPPVVELENVKWLVYYCPRCEQLVDGLWETFVVGQRLCTACFDAEYGVDP